MNGSYLENDKLENGCINKAGPSKRCWTALRRVDTCCQQSKGSFVWRPEQVCNLFDSLMQGYPFGEFMFWRV